MRFAFVLAACAAANIVATAIGALAQEPEPDQGYVNLFESSGHAAFFCEYEPSSFGGRPDQILVYNDKGKFSLDFSADNDSLDLERLKPGTPIKYDLTVDYVFSDNYSEWYPHIGMTAIGPNSDAAAAPSGCSTPDEPAIGYTGSVRGFFCGFEPSTGGGAPARVSVATGKGVYRITSAQNMLQLDELKAIPRDSPFDFDIAVSVQLDPNGNSLMPTVYLVDYRNIGTPSPGACARGTK